MMLWSGRKEVKVQTPTEHRCSPAFEKRIPVPDTSMTAESNEKKYMEGGDRSRLIAIVDKVIEFGRHGPYFVCRSGNILFTVSLDPPVWQENSRPDKGTYVIIEDLQKKPAGWRKWVCLA